MKKIIPIIAFTCFSPLINAECVKNKMTLDKVELQLSARQWVTTQTALLSVSISATLTDADLVKARAVIMANLNKIAPGDWHLTQFDRSQDSSGLEKLNVIAQVRAQQAHLTSVYQNAKKISRPGATYEINSIEFKPSLEEIQKIKFALRTQLYTQINSELALLNQSYPMQKYSVNRVVFFDGDQTIPLARGYQGREANAIVSAVAAPAPNLPVSNELIMGAMVELASNRQEGNVVVPNKP